MRSRQYGVKSLCFSIEDSLTFEIFGDYKVSAKDSMRGQSYSEADEINIWITADKVNLSKDTVVAVKSKPI